MVHVFYFLCKINQWDIIGRMTHNPKLSKEIVQTVNWNFHRAAGRV